MGPLLGPFLYQLLSLIFILFGDPFQFSILFVIWGLTGLISGIIIRKKLGAALVMLLVWITLIPILAISVYGISQSMLSAGLFEEGVEIINFIPPIPAEITFSSIFQIPIIGKVLTIGLEFIQSGQEMDFSMGLVLDLGRPFIIDFGLKPVILIVFAILGAEIGKFIEKSGFSPLNRIRSRYNGSGVESDPFTQYIKTLLVIMMLIGSMIAPLLVIGQTIPEDIPTDEEILSQFNITLPEGVSINWDLLEQYNITIEDLENLDEQFMIDNDIQLEDLLIVDEDFDFEEAFNISIGFDISDGLYLEDITVLADNKGNALLFDIFVENEFQSPIQSRNPLNEKLVGSIIISHELDLEKIIRILPIEDISPTLTLFYNLAPKTLAINIYSNTYMTEMYTFSGPIISELENFYGIDLNQLIITEFPITEYQGRQLPPLMMAVYFSEDTPETTANRLIAPFLDNGGLIKSIEKGISNDMLIPSDTNQVIGSVFVSGFIDMSTLKPLLPFQEPPFGLVDEWDAVTNTNMGFFTSFHFIEDVATGKIIDINTMLDVSSSSFSSISDLSLVTLILQRQETAPEAPTGRTVTNIPETSMIYSLLAEGVNMFGPSRFNSTYGVIEPEFLRTQIYDDFAPSISIDRQASIIDEDKIQVTISVRNEHTASISEVVVNDSQSMRTYPSAKLSTGTSTVNLGTLSPKETKSMTYTIQIKNSGQYTLSPVKTSFTYESYSYTEKSLKDIVRTNPPSSIQLAGLTWSSFGELLNRATNGSGSVVQMGIIGIFVILIGFSAFKNVIKPRMNTQSEA